MDYRETVEYVIKHPQVTAFMMLLSSARPASTVFGKLLRMNSSSSSSSLCECYLHPYLSLPLPPDFSSLNLNAILRWDCGDLALNIGIHGEWISH